VYGHDLGWKHDRDPERLWKRQLPDGLELISSSIIYVLLNVYIVSGSSWDIEAFCAIFIEYCHDIVQIQSIQI